MATTPQWVVLQNSMRIEFAHTHLHTTRKLQSGRTYVVNRFWQTAKRIEAAVSFERDKCRIEH